MTTIITKIHTLAPDQVAALTASSTYGLQGAINTFHQQGYTIAILSPTIVITHFYNLTNAPIIPILTIAIIKLKAYGINVLLD